MKVLIAFLLAVSWVRGDESLSGTLVIQDEPETLMLNDIQSACEENESRNLIYLFKSQAHSKFYMTTTLRYGQDFDLFLYDTHSQVDGRYVFNGKKEVPSGSFELLPGPVTKLAMINKIVSPYVDIMTKASVVPAGKHVAAVIKCHPDELISEDLKEEFGHYYYAELPHQGNIIDPEGLNKVQARKFFSAGLYGADPFATTKKSLLISGLAYKLHLHRTEEAGAFESFIGVRFGEDERLSYPEKQAEGFFVVHAEGSEAQILIVHPPDQQVTFTIRPWWERSVALIARKNIDSLLWLLLLNITSPSVPMIKGALLASAGIRVAHMTSWIEALILVFLAFCLANSILMPINLGLRQLNIVKPEAKRRVHLLVSRLLPLAILIPCVIFKLWGLLPCLIAMQLLITNTIFSQSPDTLHVSSLFLWQAVALGLYLVPQIPAIMAAVQYYIPIPFGLEKDVMVIWSLIVWARLFPQRGLRSEMVQRAKGTLLCLLIIAGLPSLRISHVWHGYIFSLSCNFVLSLLSRLLTK